ncbi:MAG: HD domain-containing phosphohydrolase [Sporolactobacillus sp.]
MRDEENGYLMKKFMTHLTDRSSLVSGYGEWTKYGENQEIMRCASELIEKVPTMNRFSLQEAINLLEAILNAVRSDPLGDLLHQLRHYSEWTYHHMISVALLSIMGALKLKTLNVAHIGLGALYHDIGKLYVPLPIIEKQTALSDSEWALVKTHCTRGLELLQPHHMPALCLAIVGQHHERLDGDGYPRGLIGAEINQGAQLVMINDCLDAMTAYRPYREPKTVTDGIHELVQEPQKYPITMTQLMQSLLFSK